MKFLSSVMLALIATFTSPAWSAQCSVEIRANDMMQYDLKKIEVSKECEEFTVTLIHTGRLAKTVMGHNWVLVNTPDMQAVARAGLKAGAAKDFLDTSDERIIAHTDLIGSGGSSSVTFKTADLQVGGDYTFFCSFQGHSALMKGKLIVQ